MNVRIPAEVDAKAIRKGFGLTQRDFAAAFGLPLASLRNWEQGRTNPDAPARAYLTIVRRYPDVARAVLK